MTQNLPDNVSPARPPTDGVRELLVFTALTAGVYVAGVIWMAALHWLTG